ncbi:SDR family oxidoreductase [Chitinophaga sp. YIM B06452]|uniref:SDR family NAD(P)-dependent oxidoreductase n=1 Tax=Chitinophaga sp. YIM B06452 TaxID=3082158 RepID=UPI0031FE97DD
MENQHLENRNRYALITGATSGIGYELAKLFAADGYHLILVARNEERLQEVTDELKNAYSVEITPHAKDLFVPGAAEEVYEFAKSLGVSVDVLVNDAGQGEWGPFITTELQREIDIIQLNIIALISLTKLFLRDMVNRNEGKILQLGSEAGATPMPLLSVYAATKAFVLSFSAALANEMKDKNITITVLLPGPTDTDFFHKAHQQNTVGYKEKKLDDPADAAKDGYEALMRGESKVISGSTARTHVFMSDLLGDTLAAANARKLNEPSDKAGREEITHEPSKKEREAIQAVEGDYGKDGQREEEVKPF